MNIDQLVENLKLQTNKDTTYLTHNFHPYSARFIPQIPKSIIEILSKKGDVILDPFCGCGTTLVEAKLLGRKAIGVDLNPIATLISKAKTTKIKEENFIVIRKLLNEIMNDICRYYDKKNPSIEYEIPSFENINHWFIPYVQHELAIIKAHIERIENEDLKNYLLTAFSAIIVTVSNQESETRFASIMKNIRPFRTFFEFSKKINDMNKRMLEFIRKASDIDIKVYTSDSKNLHFLSDDSIDLVITSPPYANTYDYYLYHKLRMIWLGYDFKFVQENELGSRNRHSSKKEDISSFKKELSICIKEISRVLKKGKFAVFVIGDSIIQGEIIRANVLMHEIAAQNNLKFIDEISYSLKHYSKTFNPKFVKGDKLEYIIFFQNEK